MVGRDGEMNGIERHDVKPTKNRKVNLGKKIRYTLYFKKSKLLKDCVMECHLKRSRAKAKEGVFSISELTLFLWKKIIILSEKHWHEVLWT